MIHLLADVLGFLAHFLMGGSAMWLYLHYTGRLQAPHAYKWACPNCTFKISGNDYSMVTAIADNHTQYCEEKK